jgi:peptidoglycan/xylan/chitin deacetylase (PgdA/CDA1 family)
MSLLVLMYHRARAGRHGNAPEMLDQHFAHIARHYACVLPGEPLDTTRPNVCLTFDDGYFDFYAIVFPLLIKHDLRAVLAISGSFIHERSALSNTSRLAATDPVSEENPHPEGFCTWPELTEMAASNHVAMAAHGYSHHRLDQADVDLHTEIMVPKTLLSARLRQPVDSFIFPYGRYSPAVLQQVKQHYRYAFRIGGANNQDWNGSVLYRIDADEMIAPDALFTRARLAGYGLRRHWNVLRNR